MQQIFAVHTAIGVFRMLGSARFTEEKLWPLDLRMMRSLIVRGIRIAVGRLFGTRHSVFLGESVNQPKEFKSRIQAMKRAMEGFLRESAFLVEFPRAEVQLKPPIPAIFHRLVYAT